MTARKQNLRDQNVWKQTRARAAELYPPKELDNLLDRTVDEIRRTVAGQRVAYAWSGGKDSLALQVVAQHAGVSDCVLAMSDLEYPAFRNWVTNHKPGGLAVYNTGQNLTWLRDHPEMIFPTGRHGSRWFQLVNHAGQTRYFKDRKLDILLTGRRRQDGNYIGPKGATVYRNRHGVVRYSPIAHWTHEAVFAIIDQHRLTLPPCYDWPRGYQIGTGAWPARQWCESEDHGWSEVWSIDPDVVRDAATELPQAHDWLTRTGRT